MMSGDPTAKRDALALSEAEHVDRACDRFESAWRAGHWPCIEAYLDALPEPGRTVLLLELLELEIELRMEMGESPTAEEYRLRFPDQAETLDEIFRRQCRPDKLRSTFPFQTAHGQPTPSDVPDPDSATLDVDPPADGPTPRASTLDLDPQRRDDLPHVDGALGRLVGDYLILDRLGSGGMGVVYRAIQRGARRFVALKVIKVDWLGESTEVSRREAESRFRNEAQILAGLVHDHIVPVYDVGHTAGLFFYSMRLIQGRSLAQMVRSEGPLPPRRAAYYLEAIARAIQHAHDHRVLHRDLKPGNIMVDENDRPCLIDLGLAKSLAATDYTTLTGKPLGTPEYMSPEQARGEKEVGPATDVYGLGATFFALLTGRPPFSASSQAAVMRKVIDEDPAWPRERDKAVGPELKAICLKCLEKDPSRRIASAGELATALNKYLRYEPTGYTLPGPGTRLAKWVRRQPWRAATAGLAMVAMLVAASAWAWTGHHNRQVADVFIRDIQAVPFPELPRKIAEMAPYRGWVQPRLQELGKSGPSNPELRTRIALALLPSEPARASELAQRLLESPDAEYRVIREALRPRWADVAPRLRSVVEDSQSDPARRARAAAALIGNDGPATPAGQAWSALRHAEDPGPRVELVDWLVRSEVSLKVLAAHLETEPDTSVKRQLIQAMGGLGQGSPPLDAGASLLSRLTALYRDDPDQGVHSSLAYLMRRWGRGSMVQHIDAELAGKPRGAKRWLVNSLGQTLAVVGGTDDGVSKLFPGRPHYRFAIATTETTLGQYQQFDPDHPSKRRAFNDLLRPSGPQANLDAPADVVSYDDASRFCNWLSQKEGLPADQWCYLPSGAQGEMIMAPDYLSRQGYRLPNLQEWEYAARAGTSTERYFGQSLAHPGNYAWYDRNTDHHPEPVGLLRPNDFGLFDTLGNLAEWCYNPDPPHEPDCQCKAPRGTDCRIYRLVSYRGGAFFQGENYLVAKPAYQTLDLLYPQERNHYSGFRIVKLEP
jgi:serine/threonine-protein kinase